MLKKLRLTLKASHVKVTHPYCLRSYLTYGCNFCKETELRDRLAMETPQSVNKTQNRDQCRDQATRKEGRTSTQDSFLFVPKIVCSCRVQVGKSMRASDMNLISTWRCCFCIYFFLSIFSSSLHYITLHCLTWLDFADIPSLLIHRSRLFALLPILNILHVT